MSFPLYIFLVIYLVLLLGWLIFSLIAIYHMLKFGVKSLSTFFFSFIYISVSVIMLMASYQYISQIDWLTPVEFFKNGINFLPKI